VLTFKTQNSKLTKIKD